MARDKFFGKNGAIHAIMRNKQKMPDMPKKKQFERIRDYIKKQFDVSAEHLWRIYPEYMVFRDATHGKWFGIIMNVPASRLGRENSNEIIYVLNIHVAPSIVATILPAGRFMPGYHMNKSSWTSILLNEELDDNEIRPLIMASYDSVALKPARRHTGKPNR